MRTVTRSGGEDAGKQGHEAASLHAAALAAGLLKEAWSTRSEAASPRAGVTRDLALDLRVDLEVLAGGHDNSSSVDAIVEGALRAADLANLGAASLPDLPETDARRAAAAVHLAAGAARSLCALVGKAGVGVERTEYALKDARSAAWRAGLAARQADEALENMRDTVVRDF